MSTQSLRDWRTPVNPEAEALAVAPGFVPSHADTSEAASIFAQFEADEDDLTFEEWLDRLAPSPEDYEMRHFDELTILDCKGISDSRFDGFIDL